MSASGDRTFIVLYSLHIITTVLLPIALFVLRLINPIQTTTLIVIVAGLWTWIGALIMKSEDTRQLRRFYAVVGIILVTLASFLYFASL